MASRIGWLADRLQAAWWSPSAPGAHPPSPEGSLPWSSRGLGALARPLQPVYRWLAQAAATRGRRNAPTDLRVPVLVVGNIVVGGAGKTPTVIALVEALRAMGHRPIVVSRGHGRRTHDTRAVQPQALAEDVGDEPLLVARRTGVPVVVASRRLDALQKGLADWPQTTVVVSDDGLQHLALPRSLEVIVFDERGVGNGRLLPAGPLREPLPKADLRRASDSAGDSRGVPRPARVVLYNAASPSTPLPGACASRQVTRAVPLAGWAAGTPDGAVPLERWRGRTVHAAAGIAAPERFFRSLEDRGLRLHRWPLPDHDPLDELPWPPDADLVLVTEKDAVKLAPRATTLPAVWVVPLDFALPPELLEHLRKVVGAPSRADGGAADPTSAASTDRTVHPSDSTGPTS